LGALVWSGSSKAAILKKADKVEDILS
jgi:hypothetical protein